jgi:hypothetical protein
MEPAQLQLVFNVVAITGVSSLASFCYLLRKENRRLATELKAEFKQEDRGVKCTSAAAGSGPSSEQDIRIFAADQRATWVEGMRQRYPARDTLS